MLYRVTHTQGAEPERLVFQLAYWLDSSRTWRRVAGISVPAFPNPGTAEAVAPLKSCACYRSMSLSSNSLDRIW